MGVLDNVLQFFIDMIFGSAAILMATIVGGFLSLLMHVTVKVASYSNFVSNQAIIDGWVLIRDVCNMFFILILLVIAFATILQLENYSMKRWLPKLILMAVLINFSRMIVGLLIDFSQIIMLTFVDSFASSGGSWWNFLNVTSYFTSITLNFSADTSSMGNLAAYFMGVIFLIIACVTMIGVLMVFVMRLIMLWILVVLSPLGFFLLSFPGGQKYASQYWGELKTYLMNGPVLAFFIWLAMATMSTLASENGGVSAQFDLTQTDFQSVSGVGAMQPENFIRFVLAISFLLVGLKISTQIGGYGSSWGGSAVKRLASKGVSVGMLPVKGGKALGSFGVDKLHEKTGVDLNVGRVWKGIQTKRQEKQSERYSAGMNRAREVMATKGRAWGALAMSGTPASAWEQVTSLKGFKQRVKGGKSMRKDKDEQVGKLDQANFQKEFFEANASSRVDKLNKLTNRSSEIDNKIASESDSTKKGELEKKYAEEKSMIQSKLDYGNAEMRVTRSESEIADIKKQQQAVISEHEKAISRNTPMYDFEARAADQKVVNEKMSKIKDIVDGDELGRILAEAIDEKDKAMIKAITKKMAQNGDENEYLMAHAGRSDAKGLQMFMKKLEDKAGFGEQEAMNLGSEISNTAKNTNHWAATGAYKMVNGRWEETTEAEQTGFRSGETGKMHTQAMLRGFNRLSYGYHDKETGKFHIDKGGLEILRKFNEPGAIKMINGGNFNESAAIHIAPYLDGLKEQNVINEDLYDAIKKKIDSVKASEVSSSDDLERVLSEVEDARTD